MESQKRQLETKINAFNHLDVRMNECYKNIKNAEDVVIKHKQDFQVDQQKMREEHSKVTRNIEVTESRLLQTMKDTQYWLDKYAQSHRAAEIALATTTSDLNGKMDKIEFDLSRKISLVDISANFKALNDMLFIKFGQLEDNRQTVRDMLVFQKYFYPLQMQTMIAENMAQFGVASKDHIFISFQ